MESLGTSVVPENLEQGIYETIKEHVQKFKILRYFSTLIQEICFLMPNSPDTCDELDVFSLKY